jgi:hypothetical protein
MRAFRAAITAAVILSATACQDGSSREQVEACAQRGITHFREIGSYPRLHKTGRLAEDVARDRCARSLAAF